MQPHTVRRRLSGAAAILAAFALSGLTASGAAADSNADGPTYQIPIVGECRDGAISMADQVWDPVSASSCAKRHTSQVIAVATVSADIDWTGKDGELDKVVASTCVPAFYEVLGGDFKLIASTAWSWSRWIPSPDQRSHGAAWVRCDINMRGHAGNWPLPPTIAPLKAGKIARANQRCAFGYSNTFEAVSCRSGDHWNFEWEKVILGPSAKTQPAQSKIFRAAKKQCPAARRGKPWAYSYRDAGSWAYGDHTVVCYQYEDGLM